MCHIPSDLLWSSFVELNLIDGPHGTFYVFYSHKTFVETKVMSYCILVAGTPRQAGKWINRNKNTTKLSISLQ